MVGEFPGLLLIAARHAFCCPISDPSYWDPARTGKRIWASVAFSDRSAPHLWPSNFTKKGFRGASVNIGNCFCFVHWSRAVLICYTKVFITLFTVPSEIGSYHPFYWIWRQIFYALIIISFQIREDSQHFLPQSSVWWPPPWMSKVKVRSNLSFHFTCQNGYCARTMRNLQ